MKYLLITLLSLSLTVQASEIQTVSGRDARAIMQALVASGSQIINGEGQWSGKTLIVRSDAITCHYTGAFPDELMGNIKCSEVAGAYLKESLALAVALEAYADLDAGTGNRWISVDSIECSLKYDEREYSCKLEVGH